LVGKWAAGTTAPGPLPVPRCPKSHAALIGVLNWAELVPAVIHDFF